MLTIIANSARDITRSREKCSVKMTGVRMLMAITFCKSKRNDHKAKQK